MKIRVKDRKRLLKSKVEFCDDYMLYNKWKYNYNMISSFRIKNDEGKIIVGSDGVILTVSRFDIKRVREFLESEGVEISDS